MAASFDPTKEDLQRLLPELSWIADPVLQDQVLTVWLRLWQRSAWQELEKLPVSGSMPQHSHIGHNRSVIHMAKHVADTLATFHGLSCDRDLLYAAALLQDASKLLEYEPGPAGLPVRTEIGTVLEHPFLAVHEMLNVGLRADVIDIVWHHSPEARRFPSQVEGLILYYCDQLDVAALGGHRWRRQIYAFR